MIAVVIYYGVRVKGGSEWQIRLIRFLPTGHRRYNHTLEMKRLQLIIATAMCAFGCALLAAGLFTPPVGEIHHSLLIAFGEILTFSGSLIGIDYHYRYKE